MQSAVLTPVPGFRLRSWPPTVGRAVRSCSAIVKVGWIAWQALVLGGRRPVGSGVRQGWAPAEVASSVAAMQLQTICHDRFLLFLGPS
ncbi:MAG: hypothetical protein PHW87_05490 [Methanothrix sp.]|nr:hypothetical protein [Methanothrix sp.]